MVGASMNERTTDFDRFWQSYPRRVGKLAAVKAYQRARTVATAAEILAGVERYKHAKPAYADWCHATTFLSQGRWMDEYDAPAVREAETCPHTPECHNKAWCRVVRARERGEVA
jgi:hypothetical protein